MSNPHTPEFDERFRDFYPRLQSIARRYSKTSGVAVEEFISGLSEAFWHRYQDYDVNRLDNFQSYMQTTLSQEALRIASRKEKQFQRMTVPVDIEIENSDGEEDMMAESFIDATNVDKLVTDRIFIEGLMRGEDTLAKRIVAAKLSFPDETDNAIGKMVGVSYHTVKARIKKLGEKARREVMKS